MFRRLPRHQQLRVPVEPIRIDPVSISPSCIWSVESWQVRQGQLNALVATLQVDSAGQGLRFSAMPDTVITIAAWPWHSYDFDLAPRRRVLPWKCGQCAPRGKIIRLLRVRDTLYALLAREHPTAAHSQYNALIRRLVSFERAAECPGPR